MKRALILATALAACAKQPITEVMVQVTTDLPATQLASVRIKVTRTSDNASLFSSCSCVGDAPGCVPMPILIGLVDDGGTTDHPFTVEADGFSDAACAALLVGQTATIQFFSKHTLKLDLSLLQVCEGKQCTPGSTCYDDGLCHSDMQMTLPPFDPNAKPDLSSPSDGGVIANSDGGVIANPDGGPPIRYGQAMTYDPSRKRTVMYGGAQDDMLTLFLNDTWEWNGAAWTEIVDPGAPSKRWSSGFAYDPVRGGVLLYGGAYIADTYLYNGHWTNLTSMVGAGPSPEYPRMVYDAERGELFLTDESIDNWVLPDGGSWTKKTSAHSPSPRDIFALAYHSASKQTVLFGGYTTGNAVTNETWLWDGNDWTMSPNTGPPAQGGGWMVDDTALGALVLLDVNGDTWEWNGSWTKDATQGPPARLYSRTAYDSDRQVIVLFGGEAGTQILGDTWELDASHVWRQR